MDKNTIQENDEDSDYDFNSNFKKDFPEPMLRKQSTLRLAVNLNLIHLLLIGMTNMLQITSKQSDENEQEFFKDIDSKIQGMEVLGNEEEVRKVLKKEI